jgi:hypothetical protein
LIIKVRQPLQKEHFKSKERTSWLPYKSRQKKHP